MLQLSLGRQHRSFIILIPLVAAAYLHFWNLSGFPDMIYDEGIYIRRALHVMAGLGPQEGSFNDHPYFGQLFLAGILASINYPQSLHPTGTPESIASLFTIPRAIMGILAIIDTFLVFRITQLRYDNLAISLLAGILFAVMPSTWLARRVLLDGILLPFLLTSLLFALYAGRTKKANTTVFLIVGSGIMLGIAIFTKIPAFVMIPLVGYAVLKIRPVGKRTDIWSVSKKRRAIWLVPVIAIPMIWPIYTAVSGHFSDWMKDVITQSSLKNDAIIAMWLPFSRIDPVLFALGVAGLAYTAIRRDFLPLLWFIPFTVFFFVVGYHQYFYVLPIVPALCIAASKMLFDAITLLRSKSPRISRTGVALVPIVAIVGFGLVNTAILINTDMTSAQVQAAVFGLDYYESHGSITLAASPAYSWIYPYVFQIHGMLKDYGDIRYYNTDTTNILLFVDTHFTSDFTQNHLLTKVYNNTHTVAYFNGTIPRYDLSTYPYTNLEFNREGAFVDMRDGSAAVLSPNGIFRNP